jgi:dethiobiotin synthetase
VCFDLRRMKQRRFFVTGTDTGTGKTVLTCLLVRHLRALGVAVAGLKPFCSGGRDDARALQAAFGGGLSLDEINPWHFRAPLAPLLAARREGRRLSLLQAKAHLRTAGRAFEVVVVEGAGGLLSPLGEGFTARDLIAASRATPIVVCPDRLGAINQALLVVTALSPHAATRAQIVLVAQPKPDLSARTNFTLLQEAFGAARVHHLPRLGAAQIAGRAPVGPEIGGMLDALLR